MAIYTSGADGTLQYITQDGKTVWKSDHTIGWTAELEVVMRPQPDRCLNDLQYPEIAGLSGSGNPGQDQCYAGEGFVLGRKASHKRVRCTPNLLKPAFPHLKTRLLIIQRADNYYPIGAALGSLDGGLPY